MGCSTKGTSHCSFYSAVENSFFEKLLLINSISTWSNFRNHFIFADFLLIEDYQQGTLWKELVTALFKELFKTTSLRKCNWQISLVLTVICLPLHFCTPFVGRRLWDYEGGSLRSELIIASLIEQFQISILRKFY